MISRSREASSISAGPEPQIPQWSAERRAFPQAQTGASLFCVERKAHRWKRGNARLMRLRAYVTGPRTGAAAPQRLSALRFLLIEEANDGRERKPRRAHASRER